MFENHQKCLISVFTQNTSFSDDMNDVSVMKWSKLRPLLRHQSRQKLDLLVAATDGDDYARWATSHISSGSKFVARCRRNSLYTELNHY